MNFLKKKIVVYNRKQIKKTIETMNKYYVYVHINSVTSNIFYVGKGIGRRAYSKSNRNNYWHNTVKKYGYIVDIIESELSEEVALEREKFYIAKIGRKNLCNNTDGGEGVSGYKHTAEQIAANRKRNTGNGNPFFGKKHTDEAKKLMSDQKKTQNIGDSNPFFGKTHNEDVKKKISESKIGMIPWNKNSNGDYIKGANNPKSKKVINTETNEIFDCIKDAADSFKIKRTTLNSYLRGYAKNKTPFEYYQQP